MRKEIIIATVILIIACGSGSGFIRTGPKKAPLPSNAIVKVFSRKKTSVGPGTVMGTHNVQSFTTDSYRFAVGRLPDS